MTEMGKFHIWKFWSVLINTGVRNTLTPFEIRKVRLLNGILLIGECLLLILITKSILMDAPEEMSVQLVGALLFPIPIFLNYIRKYDLAKILCILIPYFYLSVLTVYWGSERGSHLIIFACIGLVVLFFDNKALIYGLIALGGLCLIAVEWYNFDHDPIYKTEELKSAYIVNIIITIIMLTVMSTIFRMENEKYQKNIHTKNRLLLDQQQELLRLNRELEDSLDIIRWQTSYAKKIQKSILPPSYELTNAFKDHFVFFKPRDMVSGDFYFLTERDNKTFIAAVDCTGHGVPGAFMSMIGYNLLLEAIELNKIYKPSDILMYLEDRVMYSLRQKQTDNNDGMDISLCAIDQKNMVLQYAGAKNPLIAIKNEEVIKIDGDHFSIGGIHETEIKDFQNHKLSLDGVSAIYLYSDGFQDQFGGNSDKKFMSVRFRQLLHDIHQKPMDDQHEILEREFNSWKGETEQTDDVLVIGIKPSIVREIVS